MVSAFDAIKTTNMKKTSTTLIIKSRKNKQKGCHNCEAGPSLRFGSSVIDLWIEPRLHQIAKVYAMFLDSNGVGILVQVKADKGHSGFVFGPRCGWVMFVFGLDF